VDAFSLLGIEPSFLIDLNDLAARQRELSRALHPDRYVGRPSSERRAALGRAIEVNEAHRRLKDPLSRAEVLLDVLGISVSEGEQPKASPELLMDMMEKREELRDAAKAADASQILKLCEDLRKSEAKVSTSLAARFATALGNRSSGQALDVNGILEDLGELRYFRRFFDEADGLLDELA
jgi:molecular chaperone HscB